MLLIKNCQIKLLKTGIFSCVCVLDTIYFPFKLKHTKTIGNINVWKWTEARARVIKRELQSLSHTHENQGCWNQSHFPEKKICRGRAVSCLWRLHSPTYYMLFLYVEFVLKIMKSIRKPIFQYYCKWNKKMHIAKKFQIAFHLSCLKVVSTLRMPLLVASPKQVNLSHYYSCYFKLK